MAEEDIKVGGYTVAADLVTIEGEIKRVGRDKIGFGAPGTYNDVDTGHPLPTADAAAAAALALLATSAKQDTAKAVLDSLHADLTALLTELGQKLEPGDVSGLASQATLAQVLAALGAPVLPTNAATDSKLEAVRSLLAGTLNTAPTAAGDVAGTLTDGRKTVAAPGTAVALRATLACKWVCVTALKTNSSQVNVGGSGALATIGASTGQPLDAGESVTIPVNDAAKVFVDARVAGEGVSFTVGA